jgi:hypothetical protein
MYLPNRQDQRPSKLDGNGNSIRPAIISVLSGVVHDSSEQKSNGNRKLIAAYNCTTNPLRTSLRLIQRNCTVVSLALPS